MAMFVTSYSPLLGLDIRETNSFLSRRNIEPSAAGAALPPVHIHGRTPAAAAAAPSLGYLL